MAVTSNTALLETQHMNPTHSQANGQELLRLMIAVALAKGDPVQAVGVGEHLRCTPRALSVLKSAVVGDLSDIEWTSQLAEMNELSAAFFGSLLNGIFDRLINAGLIKTIPFQRSAAVTIQSFMGSNGAEGSLRPIGSVEIAAARLVTQMPTAITFCTEETLRLGVNSLFASEVRKAATRAVDSGFLAEIANSTNVDTVASTGDVLSDLRDAVGKIDINDQSTIVAVGSPKTVSRIALAPSDSGGNRIFPNVGIRGGEILPNVLLLASDSIGSSPDDLIVFDASAIVATTSAAAVSISREATINLGDGSAADAMIPFWQKGLIGMKVARLVRYVAARDDNAVVVISGTDY
jgi:hypothetical protein